MGETVYSKGYPTPTIYRQRSNLTFAIEWTGENLYPHISDFIVLRCAEHIKNHIELFVTKRDQALIVFNGTRRPLVVAKGDFLVDQYQAHSANDMGWVIAEPARFWHLYQEEPQGVVAQVPGIEQALGPDAGSSPVDFTQGDADG